MASPANEYHIHEHYSPIKTPQQLVVIAVLSFVVPVLLIVGIVQLVLGGMKVDPKSPMFSEEATAKRLQPVDQMTASQPATPSPSAPAPVAAAKKTSASGDQVYQASCAMCHGAGVAGAPKFGDKGAWKARIAQGSSTLHEHALKGIRMMPAKGGNTALADAEVKAAVDYMVAKSK
jgi:cytochrome c5